MATPGLLHSAMRVYNDSLGTTHLDAGDGRPKNLAGFRTYMWGDAAAYRLASTGKDTFDWRINAQEGNQLKRVNPGGVRSLSRTDNVDTVSQRTVLYYQDYAVVDAEIERNEGLMTLLEAGRIDMFCEKLYDVQKAKKEERSVTLANNMERISGAVPHYDEMENRSNAADQAYSYFALVNEDYLGHYGVLTATGLLGTGGGGAAATDWVTSVAASGGGLWLTKQNVDMSTAALRTKFTVNGVNVMSPRQYTYTTIDSAITNHFTALVKAVRETTYKNPPTIPTMDSAITATTNTDRVIYASSKGCDVIQASTLNTQDLWVTPSRKDPSVMNPAISGVPFEEWELLNTAAIYNAAGLAAKTTEGAANFIGPRFYLHSRSTLFPVSHKLNWFRMRKAAGNQLIPDLLGDYIDVEWTWACVDFRNQAVISPAADVVAAY